VNRYKFLEWFLRPKVFIYEEISCPHCYGIGCTQDRTPNGHSDPETCIICEGSGIAERVLKPTKSF